MIGGTIALDYFFGRPLEQMSYTERKRRNLARYWEAMAVAKELLDRAGFGRPEWPDFWATAAGGLAAAAVVLAVGAGDRQARVSPVYASVGILLALPPAAGLLRRLSSRRSSASSE
jgi:hypothetical protein